jgi:hypothetical protein
LSPKPETLIQKRIRAHKFDSKRHFAGFGHLSHNAAKNFANPQQQAFAAHL